MYQKNCLKSVKILSRQKARKLALLTKKTFINKLRITLQSAGKLILLCEKFNSDYERNKKDKKCTYFGVLQR